MTSRPHSLHTDTLRAVALVAHVADYLDTLCTRFNHPKDGPASVRNFYWVAEALSPVLPRLTKHVTRGRRMKIEAAKILAEEDREVQLTDGPRGRLP
jgi:hypothetical protein